MPVIILKKASNDVERHEQLDDDDHIDDASAMPKLVRQHAELLNASEEVIKGKNKEIEIYSTLTRELSAELSRRKSIDEELDRISDIEKKLDDVDAKLKQEYIPVSRPKLIRQKSMMVFPKEKSSSFGSSRRF